MIHTPIWYMNHQALASRQQLVTRHRYLTHQIKPVTRPDVTMDDVQLDMNSGRIVAGNLDTHFGRTLLNGLRKHEKKTFQIECISGEEETCDSVRLRSTRVALMMKKRGMKAGDIAMIVAVNHLDSCIPFIASQYIGVTPVCLVVGMTHSECKHLIGLSKPSIVFTDPEMVKVLRGALNECCLHPEIVVFGEFDGCTPFADFLEPCQNEEQFRCDDIDTTQILSIAACSSGTTGYPKLVATTHIVVATAFKLYEQMALSARKNKDYGAQLIFSPLYWSTGFMSVITACIFGQCRIISKEPFSVNICVNAIEKYKPESAYFSPVIVHAMVKSSSKTTFSSLRTVYLGGSSIDSETLDEFDKLLPNGKSLMGYGSTEVGSISLNAGGVKGSVGKPNPWLDWKIVDVDTEEKLGPNQQGEMRIKSLTMFQYYLNDADSSEAAFDKDGYYKTGDLVYYDEENNLFIVDRIKLVIKYQNYQIATAELENLIGTVPGVLMVGVVGLPSREDGELPLAFVEKLPGSKVTEKDIEDVVKNTLSDCKQLRGGVYFIEKLPLTYSGKIDRKALKCLTLTVPGQ